MAYAIGAERGVERGIGNKECWKAEARATIDRVRSEAEVDGLIMIRALVFAEDAIDMGRWPRVMGY